MTGDPGTIAAHALSKKFAERRALRDIDLDVRPGEAVAIFGPNGAGKTTLTRLLTLSLKPTSGSLTISGLSAATDAARIRSQVGLVSHQTMLYDQLSPSDNLRFFASLYGISQAQQHVDAALDRYGLSARRHDPVSTLSRGMQQRLALARALIHDPQIVVLDEPFTGLDPHAAAVLRDTLSSLREQRRTLVLVTHDLHQGLALTDRWILLRRGRVVDSGTCAETNRDTIHERCFQLSRVGSAPESGR